MWCVTGDSALHADHLSTSSSGTLARRQDDDYGVVPQWKLAPDHAQRLYITRVTIHTLAAFQR